jgi:hypothetical protein
MMWRSLGLSDGKRSLRVAKAFSFSRLEDQAAIRRIELEEVGNGLK